MKLLFWMVLILSLAQIITATEICVGEVDLTEIPCNVILPYTYTSLNCSEFTASIFNSEHINVENVTFADYGNSTLCYFQFTQTSIGSYSILTKNQDIGQVIISRSKMSTGLVLAIGFTILIMLLLAYFIDSKYGFLKLLLWIFAIVLISILPTVFIITTANLLFYKVVLWFIRVFWIVVGIYIFLFAIEKLRGQIDERK